MQVSDHALSYHWRTPAILDIIGLKTSLSFKTKTVLASILTEAHLVARNDMNTWISYSRRREWWANGDRYRGGMYTYTTVVSAIDQLSRARYIENDIAPSGKPVAGERGTQSKFRIAYELQEKLVAAALPQPIYDPSESLLLRRDGELINYTDTAHTRSIRRRLASLNEALKSVLIAHPDLGNVQAGSPVRLDDHYYGLAKLELHRVYTDTFQRHGRLYGPWWQRIPKAHRFILTMNGSPTDEVDFPALHPTIAYAVAGASHYLTGEPYEVAGVDRKVAKIAFQVLINSEARHKAVFELATYLAGWKDKKRDPAAPRNPWLPHRPEAERILAETERRHAPIASLFYSGLGLDLMSIDSTMAEAIMQRLIKRGVVVMPLHDGFRGEAQHRAVIVEEMAREMEGLKSTLSRGWTREIGNMVPHTPPRLSPPPCLPSNWMPTPDDLSSNSNIFLRDVPQICMFGSHRLDVPTLDLLGWVPGRPCPSSVVAAVRHEGRRRNLPLGGVASLVGVSGSTLSSVLHRRRPPSPFVVDGVRRLILSEAETVGGFRRTG